MRGCACDFEPGSTIAYPWRSCMLRRMFLSHRPLSIYLLTSFAISLAVGGCKSEETKEAAPEAAKADAGSTETKTPTEPENKAVEAPKPTEQATAPVEEPPKLAASIDDLFHLIADGEDGSYIMVRDPQAFVTYADEIFRFYERPLKELASASAANASINRDVSDFEKKFGEGKRQYEEAATKLKESGIDLSQGIVLTSPNKEWGDGVLIYSAKDPDAFKNFLVAMKVDDAKDLVCKALPDTGRIGCADSDAILSQYKANGDAAKHRTAVEAALPGLTLEEANVIVHGHDDGPVYLAMSTPAGLAAFHVSLPQDDADVKEFLEMTKPGTPKLLRSVQPGAGFVWANLDMAALKRQNSELSTAPAPFQGVIDSMTGEMIVAGSAEPAGVQIQLGVSNVAPFTSVLEFGSSFISKDQQPQELPDFPGSQFTVENKQVQAGINALHMAVRGIPEADVFAKSTNLSLDAWTFAANDAVTFALGVDESKLPSLISASSGSGINPATLSSLPKQLADSLGKNEVSMVVHLPLDVLHSPTVHKIMNASLKNVPDWNPKVAQNIMHMLAPLSSTTMWVTQTGNQAVAHFAMTGIGHNDNDEGKEALAAASAVAAGADPAQAFEPLVNKYGASPRLAAYRARAGVDPGAIPASTVGMIVAASAFAAPVAFGKRNETLANDLGIVLDAPVVADTLAPEGENPEQEGSTDGEAVAADGSVDNSDPVKSAEDEAARAASEAEEAKKQAEEASKKAEEAKKKAEEAKKQAQSNKDGAGAEEAKDELAKLKEELEQAKKEAAEAKKKSDQAKKEAEKAKKEADKAKKDAAKEADKAKKEAEKAKEEAEKAKKEAENPPKPPTTTPTRPTRQGRQPKLVIQ